jgi:positive regulator of sigma E activity
MSKSLVISIVSLILGLVSSIFGKQIFDSEQIQQLGEIVFYIVTFVSAYLHKPNQNGSESTPSQNSDNLNQ